MVFHCAPKAAAPSAVIRFTTCAGTRVGGICGGGTGFAAGGGACAIAEVAIITGSKTRAAQPNSRPRSSLRISSSHIHHPLAGGTHRLRGGQRAYARDDGAFNSNRRRESMGRVDWAVQPRYGRVGLGLLDDLHKPKRRNLSSNSVRVSVFGLASARRRRSSAICPSFKR